MKPTLLVLAAGMGSRYGGLKQVDPVGPNGETIMDYAVYDAIRAGFGRIVFVIRRDFEHDFRTAVGDKYTDICPVSYAYQEMTDLPAGYVTPAGREKPWGTAHAVYAARNAVDTPFAAINADDFYGIDAFTRLADYLQAIPESQSSPRFAMVGYRLDNTLSEHGSVSRGICSVDDTNKLDHVTEMTKLVRVAEGVENREDEANPVRLTGSERVSMNLWGLTPYFFELQEKRFPDWLAENIDLPKAEWYLPFFVDELIQDGTVEVEVLPTESTWFGVTYREDKPIVEQAIRELIASGAYPSDLW